MFSTLISIALVAVILGAAAYFLVKQVHDKPKAGGTTGNSDNNTEDTNDTSGNGGEPSWSK